MWPVRPLNELAAVPDQPSKMPFGLSQGSTSKVYGEVVSVLMPTLWHGRRAVATASEFGPLRLSARRDRRYQSPQTKWVEIAEGVAISRSQNPNRRSRKS